MGVCCGMHLAPFNLNLDIEDAIRILKGGDLVEQTKVASDIMVLVEYCATPTSRAHLQLAVKQKNPFLMTSWQVKDNQEYPDFSSFTVKVGSYKMVQIETDDNGLGVVSRSYPRYAHIGTGTLKERSFYPDIVYSLVNRILPPEWRSYDVLISEHKERGVTIGVYDWSRKGLVDVRTMTRGEDGKISCTSRTKPTRLEFFFAVYKVYMEISVRDSPVRYPVAAMRTTCWSCDELHINQVCSGCYNARYCCKECQRNHWPIHKKYCNKSVALRMRFE